MPSALTRSCNFVRYGAIHDSGSLEVALALSLLERVGSHEVNIWCLKGRSSGGGSGRNCVSESNIFWNSDGIPGNMQILPSNRTTGYEQVVRELAKLD